MKPSDRREAPRLRPRQVIGILGGLGPYAHLDLERKLLEAARRLAGAVDDQDFPEWILSSVPQTPDRTAAIRGAAASPLRLLLRSLRRLESRTTAAGVAVPGADFVIVACNTAHHYLEDLRRATELPIVDLIGECADHLAGELEPGTRVGLLATTGTLESGLYHRALAERGLEPRSPLDAPEGGDLQRRWVMEAVYGRSRDGEDAVRGLKGGGAPEAARARLLRAAAVLVDELGCRALVAACTEIPLAIPEPEVHGVPLVDPIEIVARAAVVRVYGL